MVWEYSGPEELLANVPLPEGAKIVRVEPHRSHLDPDFEARVAAAIGRPMDLESATVDRRGVAMLKRAVRNLGIPSTDVMGVSGTGTTDAGPGIDIHRIPGVDRARLVPEFQRYYEKWARGTWRDGLVGDLPARWGAAKYAKPETLVWFALDGYVAHVSSPEGRAAVERVAVALLAALRS